MPDLPVTEITTDEIASLIECPEPYWVEETATPRGLMTQVMLRWLQSDNTYVNPVTKQRFQVAIKTKDPEAHKFVQEHIRIAARVVCADEVPELQSRNDGENSADPTAQLDEGDDPVELGFTVLDDLGVSSPHCVLFAIEPPTVLKSSEADTKVDTDEDSSLTAPPVATPVPRQPIPSMLHRASYGYTCDCKTISATVQIIELQAGGLLTATLHSISRQKVLRVQSKNSTGTLPVWHSKELETIQLSVNLTGTGAYRIRGFHTKT